MILDAMRRQDPSDELPGNFLVKVDEKSVLPRNKAAQLLRNLGRPRWTNLKDPIISNLKGLQDRLSYVSAVRLLLVGI
jgi:hypothetical protein